MVRGKKKLQPHTLLLSFGNELIKVQNWKVALDKIANSLPLRVVSSFTIVNIFCFHRVNLEGGE